VTKPFIVFDMDGVLAEVTESYRETIIQTVRHFTGRTIQPGLIQQYKNMGGWNNDWMLSQRICADLGAPVEYAAVIAQFNHLFLGDNFDGLITREVWVPQSGLLERLASRFDLAIFTGRPLEDAGITLRRNASSITFDPMITMESVSEPKPSPQGLKMIREMRPGAPLYYVGDTVDDARSSRAAAVPFIGIAARANPLHHELTELLTSEGAIAVLDNVNELEGVLPQ
jgi:HAD superfamily phosphatase